MEAWDTPSVLEGEVSGLHLTAKSWEHATGASLAIFPVLPRFWGSDDLNPKPVLRNAFTNNDVDCSQEIMIRAVELKCLGCPCVLHVQMRTNVVFRSI